MARKITRGRCSVVWVLSNKARKGVILLLCGVGAGNWLGDGVADWNPG